MVTLKEKSEKVRAEIERLTALKPHEVLLPSVDALLEKCANLPCYKTMRNKKKIEYYNVPCSFDIETSSFYESGEKRGVMYIWQFGLMGYVITGRTWKEFIKALYEVQKALDLNEERRLICYVHNLSFEFQFMRNWFEWVEVFAIAQREPAKALCTFGVEFRCSYILSGYSLARLGDGLNRYKIAKLNGDLDYSLLRGSNTPLTEREMDYCINDVRVVMAYIQEQIDRYGDITHLQLTKTGYVRKYCRDACMYNGSHKKSTWKALEYRKMMQRLTIEPDEYRLLKRAFQGGFTHASAYHSGMVRENVESQDFTSSYPAVMVSRMFPMSKGEEIIIHNRQEFEDNLKKYCCVFNIKFKGLCVKESVPDCPISKSKCLLIKGECIENNGRVAACDEFVTSITDVDFRVYEKFYTWDSYEVGTFYRYRRGYLPTDFIKAVLKLYADKTTLKGVDGREEDYLLSKEMINSCYGMIVTDICRDENTYNNGEWANAPADIEEAIAKYNDDPKRFLFYPWGIFVTAWARYNLFTGIYALGDDFIYADTDSVKYLNPERHKAYFESYNKTILERLRRACLYHKIPFDMVAPKTIKGDEKPLGVWDDEGAYTHFKTLGAKRYMVEKPNALKVKRPDGGEDVYNLSITVSGVNKNTAVPYLIKTYDEPFKAFNSGLLIPKGATGKLTHTYLDEQKSGYLRDYRGIESEYCELSAVHMENAEYSLSLSLAYIDYLIGYREKMK